MIVGPILGRALARGLGGAPAPGRAPRSARTPVRGLAPDRTPRAAAVAPVPALPAVAIHALDLVVVIDSNGALVYSADGNYAVFLSLTDRIIVLRYVCAFYLLNLFLFLQ